MGGRDRNDTLGRALQRFCELGMNKVAKALTVLEAEVVWSADRSSEGDMEENRGSSRQATTVRLIHVRPSPESQGTSQPPIHRLLQYSSEVFGRAQRRHMQP